MNSNGFIMGATRIDCDIVRMSDVIGILLESSGPSNPTLPAPPTGGVGSAMHLHAPPAWLKRRASRISPATGTTSPTPE
ncbi:MAG: hypothetical protein GY703_12865 [Gammaproteobacteria bacterium]|nr:hypothetical protein [Gammaproteobacteria bacterium]